MIRVLAPAKVNLNLRITGLREDGYHDIESVVQKVSIHDRISLSPHQTPGITFTCSDPSLPGGPGNLAYRAAELIFKHCQVPEKGILIHLDKTIPHGAGLGGGSSDAAAVLMGLNTLWSLDLSRGELADLGQQIGSDVSLFLYPSPSLIAGRGEKVLPAPFIINAVFVIVFPGFTVSTKWAYSNFRLTKKHDKYTNTVSDLYDRNAGGAVPPDRWPGLLANDLEEAVIISHPEISRCKNDLLKAGAKASLMSGSGSAVFGLFEDRHEAELAAAQLMEDGTRSVKVALPIFS